MLLGAACCCCSPLASMKKSLRRCFSATSVQNDLSFLSASLPGFLQASSRTRKNAAWQRLLDEINAALFVRWEGGRVGEVPGRVGRVLSRTATHLVILVLDPRPRDAFSRIEILLRFEDELREELQSTREKRGR